MEQTEAIAAFGALGQAMRLQLFRLLTEAPDGMSAGTLAERLGVAPSSLSFHLTELVQSGLISQQRSGRQLIYSARRATIDALVEFLTALAA
jgi:ArsR family transcriptional regulator, arsenate/arsenite/antimonite-responsive transcriptional repressor